MADTYQDAINVPSISQHWPAGRDMPPLIAELGNLMSPWPWGALGHWRMKGEAFEEFWGQWLQDGATLDGQFGLFMEFANGTKYAIWYHDDDPVGAHQVVNFPDDNRDISILAPNIKAFFTEWASGRGIGWLDPFDYDATPALIAERTAYGKQLLDLIEAMPELPFGAPVADLQARLTATCERAFAVIDEKERQKRLVETYGDRIDLASPQQFWPRSRTFPELITKMGALIKPWIAGSIGRCDMRGQLMPDTWFENGAELHEQFGFFMVDHRYREIAIWYHDGAVPGSEPIVGFNSSSFSSDDDAVVLAPNLKAYFSAWANSVTAGEPLYGLNEEPEVSRLRPKLAEKMLQTLQTAVEPSPGAPIPDLPAFIRAHIEAERARDLANPHLQEMKNILNGRFPAPADPLWNSIFATVKGDGFEFSLTGQQLEGDTFPEGKALTPILLEARAARAKGPTASLGPWKSAQLLLHPDGHIALSGYWNE